MAAVQAVVVKALGSAAGLLLVALWLVSIGPVFDAVPMPAYPPDWKCTDYDSFGCHITDPGLIESGWTMGYIKMLTVYIAGGIVGLLCASLVLLPWAPRTKIDFPLLTR